MSTLKLPYFGEIDTQNLEDEYEAEIEFNGREVNVFLNEMKTAKNEHLKSIKSVLEELLPYNKQNRILISQDFENHSNGSVAFDYLSYHLDEMEDEFNEIIDSNDSKLNNLKKLITTLQLQTISFFSDMVVFDYCLNDEISDQLLVVKMDTQKNLSIAWES